VTVATNSGWEGAVSNQVRNHCGFSFLSLMQRVWSADLAAGAAQEREHEVAGLI
jgi:hypothetical protein